MKRPSPKPDEVILAKSSLARALADWSWKERNLISLPTGTSGDAAQTGGTSRSNAPHARAVEALALLQEVLREREQRGNANNWRTVDVRSRLGGAMLAEAVTNPALGSFERDSKISAAEELLLKSYEKLKGDRKVKLKYHQDAIARLVRLYEAVGDQGKVASWQKEADSLKLGTVVSETSE